MPTSSLRFPHESNKDGYPFPKYMLNSKSLSNIKYINGWQIATIAGILLTLSIHIAFFFLGRVNADEGWYLYTSQLVYGGQRPYQDFAFTQTPVLLYFYGLPQLLFSGSLYIGRVTSVVLSMSAMVLSLGVARRYAGDIGHACLLFYLPFPSFFIVS